MVGSPWASGAGDVARYRVECALGAYSLDNLVRWDVPGGVDGEALALALSQHPCQGVAPCKPLKLLNDGDLLHLLRICWIRGAWADQSCEKGNGTGEMVVSGHVRALDEAGHDEADDAADFGRRRGPLGVIDSWRHFAGLCSFWYPVLFCSLRFFIAIARVAVNEGGEGRGGLLLPLCLV